MRPRTSSSRPASLLRGALFIACLGAAAVLARPSTASASQGYELVVPIVGAVMVTAALDTTFVVATATGLTYHDDAWAIGQLTWAGASLAASAIGMGFALDQGIDGLAGGLALQAIGSVVLGVYAIVGLLETNGPGAAVAVLPRHGGAELSLVGQFE